MNIKPNIYIERIFMYALENDIDKPIKNKNELREHFNNHKDKEWQEAINIMFSDKKCPMLIRTSFDGFRLNKNNPKVKTYKILLPYLKEKKFFINELRSKHIKIFNLMKEIEKDKKKPKFKELMNKIELDDDLTNFLIECMKDKELSNKIYETISLGIE